MQENLSYSQPIVVELWSAEKPAPHPATHTLVESTPDDKGRIYNISNPTITLFLPTTAKTTRKPMRAVIICPGGSYQYVATGKEGDVFAKFLATNGIAGIVLKYRTPNGVPEIPFEDADRAIEIVHQNAAAWGVDPSKIGIMGFSSGGHVAAITSVRGVVRPAFSILFYPLVSLRHELTHEVSCNNLIGELELRYEYSAELLVDQKTPPTLIFCTLDDFGVSITNTHLFNNTLLKNNIRCDLEVYATGGHGWGFSLRMADHEKMKAKLISWTNEI